MQLNAYMDNDGRWYVDDNNGFSKAENELVCGVPEAIRHFVPKADKVVIRFEHIAFPGSAEAIKLDQNKWGATFQLNIPDPIEFWLCPVFFYYLPIVPQKIYVAAYSRK